MRLLILLFLIPCFCFGQNQNNIWYFGISAGIDFNGALPVVLTDGQLNSTEAAAIISDRNTGQLLFYSDGIIVWNANHDTMPNGTGLMGCGSSTQGALIVPKPESDSLYYLFTADCAENNYANGLRYSTIDMSLDGGLGDVIQKNKLLHTPMTEKLTAVTHANGRDFWVIAHEYETDSFYTYLVDCSGVDTVPVITSIGVVHGLGNFYGIGYLKSSPNGEKLALARFGSTVEVFDFNDSTGVISNTYSIPNIVGWPFGVAFSPDNKKLYVTIDGIPNGKIYQYDLSSGDTSVITSSQTVIYASATHFISSLQLAPDSKIYAVHRPMNETGDSSLAVINYPDSLGLACNFQEDVLYLMGNTAMRCLPNIIETPYNEDSCFTLSSDNIRRKGEVKIYPNPTTGTFTVQGTVTVIQVYDLYGHLVLRLPTGQAGTNATEIDMGNYPAGIYIVRAGGTVRKLIVH